jgi:hypothetical protein
VHAPLVRPGRVEVQVGRAGQQDAEHPGQPGQAARAGQPDHLVAADAGVADQPGHAGRAVEEPPVGDRPRPVDGRDLVRGGGGPAGGRLG